MNNQVKIEIEVKIPRLSDSYVEEENIEEKLNSEEYETETFILEPIEANDVKYKFLSGPGSNKIRINIQGFYKEGSNEFYDFYKRILDSNKHVSNIKFYLYLTETNEEILIFESQQRVKQALDIFYEEKVLSNDKEGNYTHYLLTFLGESVV